VPEWLATLARSKVARWTMLSLLVVVVVGGLGLAAVTTFAGGSASVGEWFDVDYKPECACDCEDLVEVQRQVPGLAIELGKQAACCAAASASP